ncbi:MULTISPECIES: TetR family transcriptional regulator C-terminal domain-containing protein [Sphingobium]|jgi:TetR/AcrR family transcriptional regulator, transcriptional repressor of bet genes|uniref:TetR family transcriptional regulator C-terminal domain-containing protein n=1 Tax=Sphingobium TaxID=165695 RepID=UPI000C4232AD|nr:MULTISPECIES: TetR family transcriptional regulator C-terminal domain-containing protein [Sphingobium]MAP44752.1 TetR family transcriptional regulator [Sphingobium sp.]MCC4255736.1 TetR family transcriptional regulator C-terminal domain-containing protein [Sphingobium lactosutens]MEE2742103.1 TetR family transcriptional regulator C-terminal domain-containing protein [Pseudomonadota bacterium]
MAQPAGPRARARFVRETPDVRRQALIDATARCLAEKGIGGTSVRAICARAGVSSGLLTHYFPGVDALILATYVDVGARVSAALDAAIASAGNDPRDRLRACLLANLRPPVLDPDLLATWIAFWSLVTSDPAIAAVHADVYGGTRHQLETLLGEAAPQLSQAQKRIAAISLTALVDGLWLELCLDRSSFTAEEAQAMAESAMMQWLGANDEQVDKSGAL